MTLADIPATMTAVVLDDYTGPGALRVEQRPVPVPGKNQVLVRMAASPINPSDLAFLEGLYGFKKPLPIVPGFEGSGVVVAAGPGLMGRYLLGKRVACVSQNRGDGIWSAYVATSVNFALPLNKAVSLEQGAMSLVNPLTALAFLTLVKNEGQRAIVQTAAAGVLGQMINRLCQGEGIHVINVVRKATQVDLLKAQGANIVLNSSEPEFDRQLREACHQHQARLGFDAVAGSLTMRLLEAMPAGSRVIVYGGLSYEPAQASPGQLIFQDKVVSGFWLSSWLAKKNPIQSLLFWRRAQKLMETDLRSDIRARYPLEEAMQAITDYQNNMTGGKVLLVPAGE